MIAVGTGLVMKFDFREWPGDDVEVEGFGPFFVWETDAREPVEPQPMR